MSRKIIRRPGEYCTNECRNKECLVNLKNKPKGEWPTIKAFCGSVYCKGYIRPQ